MHWIEKVWLIAFSGGTSIKNMKGGEEEDFLLVRARFSKSNQFWHFVQHNFLYTLRYHSCLQDKGEEKFPGWMTPSPELLPWSKVAFIVCCNAAAMYRLLIYRSSMQRTAPQGHFLAVPQCSIRRRDGNSTTATHRNATAVDYERSYPNIVETPLLCVTSLFCRNSTSFSV